MSSIFRKTHTNILRKAIKWFNKAADQGLAEAQCTLGICYYTGDGVEQNNEEAAKLFLKAAEQGDPQAQYNLGIMYFEGDGVAKDVSEAEKWLKKSADQGNAEAAESLKKLEELK